MGKSVNEYPANQLGGGGGGGGDSEGRIIFSPHPRFPQVYSLTSKKEYESITNRLNVESVNLNGSIVQKISPALCLPCKVVNVIRVSLHGRRKIGEGEKINRSPEKDMLLLTVTGKWPLNGKWTLNRGRTVLYSSY